MAPRKSPIMGIAKPADASAARVMLATAVGPGKEYCFELLPGAVKRIDGIARVECLLDGVKAPDGFTLYGAEIADGPAFVKGGNAQSDRYVRVAGVRAALREKFLGSDCTHLYFHDADTIAPAWIIAGLMALNVPAASGVYPVRSARDPLLSLLWDADRHEYVSFSNEIPGGADVVRPLGCGAGCLLLTRAAVEAVPFREPAFYRDNLIGEDYQLGIDLAAWSGQNVAVDLTQSCWHVDEDMQATRIVFGGSRFGVTYMDRSAPYVRTAAHGEFKAGVTRHDISPDAAEDLDYRFVRGSVREATLERAAAQDVLSGKAA